jgi:hypothetical protein
MRQTAFLLILAALVAEVTPFRASPTYRAFVVRGGGDEVADEVINNLTSEEQVETVVGDDGKNEELDDDVKDDDEGGDDADKQVAVCAGGVCTIRGGSDHVAEGKDLGDEEEYEYDEEEEEVELEAEVEEEDELEDELEEDEYEEEEEGEIYLEEDELAVPEPGEAMGNDNTDNEIEEETIDDDEEAVEQDEIQEEEVEDFNLENPVEEVVEEAEAVYETEVHHHTTDDDSSAFVDREELADAYEDDETVVDATSFRAGHSDEDDRASIDDVPGTNESAGIQEYEQTEPEAQNKAEVTEEEESVQDLKESVQPAVMSKEVEQILVQECGFRKAEIRGMKPQIANVMAEKRLRRPLEGIPASWYDTKKKGLAFASLGKVLSAIIPVALGALAIFGGLDVVNLLGLDQKELAIPESVPEEESPEEEDEVEEEIPEEPKKVLPEKKRRFRRGGAQIEESWLYKKMDAVGDRMKTFVKKETPKTV